MKSKSLLISIILAAIAMPARADIIASMIDAEGGAIMLSDQPCAENKTGRVVASTGADGRYKRAGCGTVLTDELLLITWADGSQSVLPAANFTPNKKRRGFNG